MEDLTSNLIVMRFYEILKCNILQLSDKQSDEAGADEQS